MTRTPAEVAADFYAAFSHRDPEGMVRLYHPHATFTDAVFGTLNAEQTTAMWRMLLGRQQNMQVTTTPQPARPGDAADVARTEWIAVYPFSATGRTVRNVVQARMTVRDGLIVRHEDTFDFWAWSRQALGLPGLLLGWTPMLHARVSRTAQEGLAASMAKR
ncbi:nuclear transport factor 2 family protein [Deinococcus aquiradiocola]|uniref:SnoaL-like domain-containing protein n=1 Tax=Deinococcus aquiradiocola TaxID=393059 RepID=A0A917PIF3_9DEIO|nr:nuclear transport factor 2 family protein [Deinococcus aquiradiocola]GGJ79906.1 hypothetical protein GCM10008939_24730 [Deinococcus aquiradiocola]